MTTNKTTHKQDKTKDPARQVMGIDVNERQEKNTAIFNTLPKDIVSKALSSILETQGFSREISKLSQNLPGVQLQKAVEAAMAPSKAIKDAMRGVKIQSAMQQMPSVSVSNMRSLPALPKMPTPKNLHKNPPGIHAFSNVAELGKVIRGARKSKGLTQQKFADLAGVGRRFLSELEQGKQTLEIGKVIKVASAAGIQLAFSAVDTSL